MAEFLRELLGLLQGFLGVSSPEERRQLVSCLFDVATADEGLKMMGIDDAGLVGTDRRILAAVTRGDGEPVGLKTITVSVGEDEESIEEVYEPYLIQEGYLQRTPQGRIDQRRFGGHTRGFG